MTREKELYIEKVKQVATALVYAMADISILADRWDDEFKTGKTSEITEEEANQKGTTLAELATMRQFETGIMNFWTNKEVVQAEYGKATRALMGGYR